MISPIPPKGVKVSINKAKKPAWKPGDVRERGPIREREFRESERTRKANARDYMNAMPGAMQLYPGGRHPLSCR